jgi:hypothetical protein
VSQVFRTSSQIQVGRQLVQNTAGRRILTIAPLAVSPTSSLLLVHRALGYARSEGSPLA